MPRSTLEWASWWGWVFEIALSVACPKENPDLVSQRPGLTLVAMPGSRSLNFALSDRAWYLPVELCFLTSFENVVDSDLTMKTYGHSAVSKQTQISTTEWIFRATLVNSEILDSGFCFVAPVVRVAVVWTLLLQTLPPWL